MTNQRGYTVASFNQLRRQAHEAATSGGSAAVTSLANVVEQLCQKCEELERLATSARAKDRRAKAATMVGRLARG
jgi:hypothetical protein